VTVYNNNFFPGPQACGWLALAGLWVFAACSSDGTGSGPDIVDVIVGDVASDQGRGDGRLCDKPLDLETVPAADAVLAGDDLAVACRYAACPEAEGEFALQVGGDPAHYEVDGLSVRFLVPGEYELACVDAVSGGTDGTPSVVDVSPGIADSVETSLAVSEVKAGTQLAVECAAWDGLGNPIYGPFEVVVSPDDGVWQQGTLLTPTKVGKLQVTCVVDAIHMGNAVPLTVVPNVPQKIFTELAANEVVAGKSVKISCQATDYWENHVTGFPMVVVVPPKLSLQGLAISGTETGIFEVKCVPQAEEWVLFQLHPQTLTVVPGAPALMKVELVPDKPVYKVLDKTHLQVAVRDMYGNLLPDAPLQPIQVTAADGTPTDGVVETQSATYKFLAEGAYKFTVVSAQDAGVKAQVVVNVDGSGPLLSIDYPERGETIDDKPVVNVSGTVSDDVTGLESFTINGEEVSVNVDQSFSQIVVAHHSVNHLVAEAKDAGGETTRTTRAFAFSDRWYKASGGADVTFVPEGFQLFLSETFVDDGNHDHEDPDDLATILEVILGGLDFASLLPNPIYNANNYKVFITNVTLDEPQVAMDLIEAALAMNLTFGDFTAKVDAQGSCSVLGVDLCPDVSGTLTVDSINLYAIMDVHAEAGGVAVVLKDFQLGVSGIALNLSGLGSLLDPILNGIISLFESQVEQALAGQLQGMLPDLVAQLFEAFQLDQNLEIPGLVAGAESTTVNLKTTYALLELSPSGIKMVFDARASSGKKILHAPLGALGRGSCAGPDGAPFAIDTSKEVSVALFDDLLNQLLFAVWWGGALNITLDEAVLAGLGDQLAGYGLTEPTIQLDFFLPPMLSDCNDEQALRLAIGDLYVQAQFKMLGQPITLGMFLTATGDASLSLVQGESGQMEFGITVDQVGLFDYEIVSVTEGFEELIPMLEELLADDVLASALSGIAGQSLGGIALPEIDLGGLIPGVAPGTALTISPVSLERLFGFTQLAAELD
jgi:hypothetical protein